MSATQAHAMTNAIHSDTHAPRNDLHPSQRKRILFYRDYQRFQGGHLKVWHYFQHAATSHSHEPRIYFTDNSLWDATNPWSSCQEGLLAYQWQPEQADVLFLAGLDWQAVPPLITVPVINLIQSVSHADEENPRKAFLTRPALRICVGEEVRQAVVATGLVNGPTIAVPNCIDLPALSSNELIKGNAILIAGMKNPAFAMEVARLLEEDGHEINLLLSMLPRKEFLNQLKAAHLVILLPMAREGFFLPALEAMAMGCLVVCPDCIGNRSFCLDGVNSFRPDYRLEAVVQSAKHASRLCKDEFAQITSNAKQTVENHDLTKERHLFHDILRNLNEYI